MALSFDETYYMSARPDVLTAYIGAGAEVGTGMSWAQFAEQHYNDFGWKEGYNPNAIFNTSEYLAANIDVLDAGVNPFQHYLQFGAYEKRAPSDSFISFEDFDWETYLAANSDLTDAGIDTAEAAYGHYVVFGQFEVRDGKPEAPVPSVPGETYTLTRGLDKYTGTANDDVFEGFIDHLNGFDHLIGGGGHDVLNLHGDGDVKKLTTQKVEGIETINIIGTGKKAVDASSFKGAKEVWQVGRAGTISGLAEGVIAGFSEIGDIAGNDHIKVNAAADATSLSIALDDVGTAAGGQFAFAASGAKVTTLNLSGSIQGEGILTIGGLGDKVDTVNLAMTSKANFGVHTPSAQDALVKNVKTIDASKSTGDLIVELGRDFNTANPARLVDMKLETVVLGSGKDAFYAAGNFSKAKEVSVDAGAGADTIRIDLTVAAENALSLTGGEGADTFIFTGGNVKVDAEGKLLNSVSVTDFGNGADTLKLAGFQGFSAQDFINIAVGNLDADATLHDAALAVAAVANQTGVVGYTGWAQFEFDGNTYVYGNTGNGTGVGGDMLIEFVGGALLTADNVAAA